MTIVGLVPQTSFRSLHNIRAHIGRQKPHLTAVTSEVR